MQQRRLTGEQDQRSRERLERVHEMLNRAQRWFVLTVPPQKETVVERVLMQLGFDAFVPIEFRWRRIHSRQKTKKFVPYIMASRYVFVGFGEGAVPWHKLFALRVIGGVIQHDDEPVAIPPSVMRELFAKSGEEAARESEASSVRLNRSIVAGDLALITEGPFRGNVVKIHGIDRGKARVILDIFQQAQEVEINLDALDAA